MPSSPPDTMNGSRLFQEMTLTSASWACVVSMQALEGAALQSHTRTVWSTEQEANTCSVSIAEHSGTSVKGNSE